MWTDITKLTVAFRKFANAPKHKPRSLMMHELRNATTTTAQLVYRTSVLLNESNRITPVGGWRQIDFLANEAAHARSGGYSACTLERPVSTKPDATRCRLVKCHRIQRHGATSCTIHVFCNTTETNRNLARSAHSQTTETFGSPQSYLTWPFKHILVYWCISTVTLTVPSL
jgi:hypothetical protein